MEMNADLYAGGGCGGGVAGECEGSGRIWEYGVRLRFGEPLTGMNDGVLISTWATVAGAKELANILSATCIRRLTNIVWHLLYTKTK